MTPTEEIVSKAFMEAIEVDAAGPDDDIYSLGGDSVHAVRVALKLGMLFDLEFPPELLEESLTVRAAAAWIDEQLAKKAT